MTMTSVAVAPVSLGAPTSVLTPKMFHLQQGLNSTSPSPTPGKSYDTLSKGKKSWSVRLGLSRQSQSADDAGKGWGTISGGSVISRQMIYGDQPWLYGTVRSSRPGHEPRGFMTPPPPPPPGAPVLVVCSCPEFLNGTTRKLGNCRKCGGHRLAGVPLGGTCRLPQVSSRSRPSLAGVLRSPMDDPYDQMRRNRLLEPRTRARSISPHRPITQRDSRSLSIARNPRKGSIEGTSSRSEWFDKETPVSYEEGTTRRQRASFTGPFDDDWQLDKPANPAPATPLVRVPKKPRPEWSDCQIGEIRSNRQDASRQGAAALNSDSRRSILECDVNPYLLLKKLKDEDDLSDDLSDNALEQEERISSSLFDSSKVKSIERIQSRSAVAAIGGQRIRVFNEPHANHEISDDEDLPPVTRIPIPKVSPRRPPRRFKEAKQTLKSILKRGKIPETRRKNVLFNVDNVIFAPEKPSEMARLNWRVGRVPSREETSNDESEDSEELRDEPVTVTTRTDPKEKYNFITIPNIRDPKVDKVRFKECRFQDSCQNFINPDQRIHVDKYSGLADKISSSSIERGSSRRVENEDRPQDSCQSFIGSDQRNQVDKYSGNGSVDKISSGSMESVAATRRMETGDKSLRQIEPVDVPRKFSDRSVRSLKRENMKSEVERIEGKDDGETRNEIKDRIPRIAVDEKDFILMSEENSKRSSLSRSQSDRSFTRPEVSAGDVFFADTMRLSLCRKLKETSPAITNQTIDEMNSESHSNFAKEIDSTPIKCETELANIKEEETLIGDNIKSEDKIEAFEDLTEIIQREEKFKDRTEILTEVMKKKMKPEDKTETLREIPENKINSGNKTEVTEIITKKIKPEDRTEVLTDVLESQLKSEDKTLIEVIENENETDAFTVRNEHFRGMRPTSWSPPPGKMKRYKASDSKAKEEPEKRRVENGDAEAERSVPAMVTWSTLNSYGPSKIEIGSPATESNVYKITVSPQASPMVHRLQIDSGNTQSSTSGSKRTSILINTDSIANEPVNKVTISVGGENSVYNPTVISVNSPPKDSKENKTLVIVDNYKANIVVPERDKSGEFKNEEIECHQPETPIQNLTTEETRERRQETENPSKLFCQSREILISKLLEDSLRKARENGEVLDEDSGEAILKILKQTLLKSKEYESSESTLEPNYSRTSSLNSEGDFVSTNLFLEENPYEVIKEPIYEEIPDEPPPLPLSPPPSEDYLKDRIYFGGIDYYNKNTGQFLGSYLTENAFKPEDLGETYLSKSPEDFFKKMSPGEENISSKFDLLNFLMDSKDRASIEGEDEDEEDTEGDLEALYEQKETSLGDLSSKSSQISNVSDSSEECNIILTNSSETCKARVVDIERTDSGVGSESSQASSTRGVPRRWRAGNAAPRTGSLLGGIPQVISGDSKLCEDCEQRLDPLITDSGVVYAPFVCRKCSKKRVERKEIITEIVETEQKYGRDLQIILEEFHKPMLRAGLLTSEQLSAIFLNAEELLEHNLVLAEKLKDAVEFAQESGDEDLLTVDVGKIFLESERMLHAFESYCTRQGGASLLLQNLEKEKELLRIFLKVSQMENTVLRRMNLNSFLMVPVQRVTKYPLLLARLLKATPSVRADIQEAKERLKQAQANIELHLEHMNAEAKDVTSTKLWRRISIIQNGRRPIDEQDIVNIKLKKMAVEVLEWAHEEAKFVLEGRLLVAQPTDNNWRRGRTVKLAPVTAMLVTNTKQNAEDLEFNDDSLFPKHVGIKEATLLLVKEKLGRYSLLREPLYLDKCIVCCETDLEDYFEIQELSSKETFIFKAEDGARTKRWCRTLQAHAQSLGAWRKRRGALPNIMICGVARN